MFLRMIGRLTVIGAIVVAAAVPVNVASAQPGPVCWKPDICVPPDMTPEEIIYFICNPTPTIVLC